METKQKKTIARNTHTQTNQHEHDRKPATKQKKPTPRSLPQRSHGRQRAARGPEPEAGDAPAEEPGGGAGVPAQEEGVHQVPGEPSGRAGEPEQGAHRGAQVAQGALLPAEERLSGSNAGGGGGGAKIVIICCHARGVVDGAPSPVASLARTRTTTTTTRSRRLFFGKQEN